MPICFQMLMLLRQGLPNNFNHPALEELCVSFYYGSSTAIGNIFPEEMEELPFNAISLAAAAVCNKYTKQTLADWTLQLHCSLAEVRDGTKCLQFSAEPTYKGLQQALVALMSELDALPDHGPKLCKLFRKFALHGK